ncbi:MAG: PIG-L family deacetylase, partial [Actinobacteria bacterium]|nr:PIG-L family deacetylase [Actinomycetota bacterium]
AARSCATSTVMGVWAHYDDDLIFSNPGLQAAITAGDCVRTLFVTASDAGRGSDYYHSRELGILRAYNLMRGSTTTWTTESMTLLSGAHLTMFTPQDDPRLSIATLRLPDGGIHAKGFTSTGNVGIPSLLQGTISSIAPVDGGPALTADSIRQSIAELASAWGASDVDTLIPTASALANGDHPDHGAAGTFTRQALLASGYPVDHIHYFVGYPSKGLPANVSGDTLTRKVDIYRTYAREDVEIACADNTACLARRSFGDWLQRSYAKTDAELAIP